MKKLFYGKLIGTIVSVTSLLLFHSCGGGGSGGASSSQSGKVALYVTDDISGYQQVTLTIHKVQFVNSGTQAVCDVYTASSPSTPPLSVDIANLSNVLQLTSVAECASVPYNRIDIEFEKGTELLDDKGTGSQCWFTSYLEAGSQPGVLPNMLQCDSVTNICVLQVRGAVRSGALVVLSDQPNKLALDFNLQDFSVVSFGTPTCSVTMKVTPLNAAEMMKSNHPEGIAGKISNLDTASKTFTLTKGNNAFAVNYSGIVDAKQPGLDALLQKAETDGLRVTVMSASIDMSNNSIDASAVYARVEGTVSSLDSVNHTFTLTYQSTKTINVNYASPAVDGTLADSAWVEVKFDAYDTLNSVYRAYHVEVEAPGTITEF